MRTITKLLLISIFLTFALACGDDDSSSRKKEFPPPPDTSCCPEPAQALLCGQCPVDKPCETTKPFTSLVCTDSVFFYLKHAYPEQAVWYSYVQVPTRGNPTPPDACCPAKQCGIYQFWCLPEYPCSTENTWLFIYYQPLCDFGPCNISEGWKLLELLPEGKQAIWDIKTN